VRWSGDRAAYVIATGATPAEAADNAAAGVAGLVFTVAPRSPEEPWHPASDDREISRENDLSRLVGYQRTDSVDDD
jgi:hypothetical protein